jgi:hypothetical protein
VHYHIKNRQKWIRGEKVMTLRNRGGSFLQKILNQKAHSLFSNLSKKNYKQGSIYSLDTINNEAILQKSKKLMFESNQFLRGLSQKNKFKEQFDEILDNQTQFKTEDNL